MSKMRFFKKHYPLLLSVIYILILVLLVFLKSYSKNDGNFIYAVDDAYIHMSLSKNIVENQIMGVTKYEFTSCTSSPLWTGLLTIGYFTFGVNIYLLFIFNILSSFILIFVIYFIFRSYDLSNLTITLLLIFIITIAPFTLHIFTGMEHLLQTSLIISFIFLSSSILMKDKVENKLKIFFLVITFLTTSVRYESLFLLFIVFVLLLLRRKFLFSVLFLIVGLLPIILYGYVSVSNGQYFFPNSVLINGNIPQSFSSRGLYEFIAFRCRDITDFEYKTMILIIVILIFIYLINEKRFWNKDFILLIIFISYYVCLSIFSDIIYFRFVSSIFICGIVIISVCLYNLNRRFGLIKNKLIYSRNKTTMILLCIVFIIFLIIENIPQLGKTLVASCNIYEQQYQMSKFLNKYYNESSVAINDIGLISFNTEVKLTDLEGLGSIDVLKSKRNKYFNQEFIYDLAKIREIKIAILYDSWFEDIGLPKNWIKVGEWKISNNVICGDDVVTFYAVELTEKDNLILNLKDFFDELPETVIQRGIYIDSIDRE